MVLRTTVLGWAICVALASSAIGQQHVVIVLDNSGSMNQPMRSDRSTRRIDAARSALRTVIGSMPEDAWIGVLLLNSRTDDHWAVPLGPIDRATVDERLDRITADGWTPLGARLKEGADKLLITWAERQTGSYRLLVISDGEATDAGLVESYLPEIRARGLIVDVIGVDMANDHSLAIKVDSYRRADRPETLTRAITEVLAEQQPNPQDPSAEEDYQLLRPLPEALARAAVAAFSQVDPSPITGRNIAPAESVDRPSGPRASRTNPPGSQRPAARHERTRPGRFRWSTSLIVLLCLVAILYKLASRLR